MSVSLLFGFASGATASPSLPTLPSGQVLGIVGFYDPKQFATVDVTTGVATVDPSTTGFSTLSEVEGAGFENATGKTWLLNGTDCSLWLLNSDGTTTQQFALPATTALPDLQACFALMLNQDGTAYITADVTNNNEDSIIRVNLADGTLVAGSVKDTAEIAGLSKDPTTGDVWASIISNHDAPNLPMGLYKINVQTGVIDSASQILKSVYDDGDAWDVAFDSSGRLWMLTWDSSYTDSKLVSIDPDAPNPGQTFNPVAYVLRSGDNVSLGTDAMWIQGESSVAPSIQSEPTLANTGINTNVGLMAGGAALAALIGAGAVITSRRRTAGK